MCQKRSREPLGRKRSDEKGGKQLEARYALLESIPPFSRGEKGGMTRTPFGNNEKPVGVGKSGSKEDLGAHPPYRLDAR